MYTFIPDEIKVTYPIGGERLVPGNGEIIHWDAYGDQGVFNVAYSTNNGSSWNTVANGLSGSTRLVSWVVPNTLTSEALVRVSRGGKSDQSDAPFAIIRTPGNLNFTNSCKTGARLNWNAVTGASSYEVLRLGEKYMEVIATTTSLFYDFNDVPESSTEWFSVRAVTSAGAKGQRADAISFFADPMLVNCRNTINLEKTTDQVNYNAGDTIEYTIKFTSFYDAPITNVVVTDVLGPTWNYIPNSLTCGVLNEGTITLDLGTVQPDEMITCSFKVRSDVLLSTQTAFEDDLESGTANWTVNNQVGPATWTLTTTMSNSPISSWL